MSKFPIWWTQTITIYNQYKDPTTKVIKWYRTKLSNCFWKNIGARVDINNVVIDTHNITVRIPKNSKYLASLDWKALTNDKMSRYFTLQENDIIVLGNCKDDIDEYTSGKRSTDFLNNHKGEVLTIKEYSIDTFSGINIPHYRILGD